MAPGLGRQADAVAQHHARPFDAPCTQTDNIGGGGGDGSGIAQRQRPGAMLDRAAVIAKDLGQGAGVAFPFAVHVRNKARGDPAGGAVDHALALKRAGQVLAQVELRAKPRIIRRGLRLKRGIAAAQRDCGKNNGSADQGGKNGAHDVASLRGPERGVRARSRIALSFNTQGSAA